jgi:hypothetical protein
VCVSLAAVASLATFGWLRDFRCVGTPACPLIPQAQEGLLSCSCARLSLLLL